MSTVSRQYLQELPEMKRREREEKEFMHLFQLINTPLMAAAELGETKYLFDMKPWARERQQQQQRREQEQHDREMRQLGRCPLARKARAPQAEVQTETPSEELLAGLREKFPGCTISLQEDWVETRQGVKELKKGIMIDWS